MKKSAFCLWWIGLLLLAGPVSFAQDSKEDQLLQDSNTNQFHHSNYDLCFEKGNHLFDQKSYHQAIPYFEEALKIKRREKKPDSIIPCLVNLALVVAHDQQFERARAHLEEAIWYSKQESSSLSLITSQHLITNVRQSIDALESRPAAVVAESYEFTPIFVLWDKIWYFLKYGASTGCALLFFIFGLYIFDSPKLQMSDWESLHIRHLLDYIEDLYMQEKAEKEALIHENKRLAGVMQDDLGNLISSVKMHIDQIEEDQKTPRGTISALQKASQWLEEACVDLRGISRKLEIRKEQTSLVGLLAQYREFLLSASDFEEVKIHDHGLEGGLTSRQEAAVYGIVMTWCRRLSFVQPGRRLDIQIYKDEEGLNVMMEDDGAELILDNITLPEEVFLIQDLNNRIAAMNGELEIDSSPMNGNMLLVKLKNC